MEPLYKTKTKYTLSEYRKYNMTLLYGTKTIIMMILFGAIFWLCAYIMKDIIIWIFALVFLIYMYTIQVIRIKKVYNSNKAIQDMEVEFEFYEEYFTQRNRNGEEKIEYSLLYKIIENKTNIYLMIAKNQGYLLEKNNLSEDFSKFIHSKCEKKNS